jgi:hypothetical protein
MSQADRTTERHCAAKTRDSTPSFAAPLLDKNSSAAFLSHPASLNLPDPDDLWSSLAAGTLIDNPLIEKGIA